MQKSNKPIIFITLSCLVFVASLFYTKNIQQLNPESLFLEKSHYEILESFEKESSEGHKLLYLIEDWQTQEPTIEAFLDEVENTVDGVKILNPLHVYQFAQTFQYQRSWSNFLSSFEKLPAYFPRLMTENSLLIVFNFDRQVSINQLKSKIEMIEKLAVAGKLRFWPGGMPYVNYQLNRYSDAIRDFYFPIIFVSCFLLLLLILRNLKLSLLIFIPSLVGSIFTLSLIKILFEFMTMISAITPIMIFILNLALGFHLTFTFQQRGNWQATWLEKKRPIILMIITTAIGFFSLFTSSIEAVRQFALISGVMLIISSAWHLLWAQKIYPVVLKIENGTKLQGILASQLYQKIAYPMKLAYSIPLMLILTTSGLVAGKMIPFETEAANYFPSNSFEAQALNQHAQNSLGMPLFELLLPVTNNPWDNLSILQQIAIKEDTILEKISNFPFKIKMLSPAVALKEANFHLTKSAHLPENELALKNLTTSISEDLKTQYASSNFYRITIFGPSLNQEQFDNAESALKKLIAQYPELNLTGKYYALRAGQNSLVDTLIKSIAMSSLLIALLSGFYLRRLKTILSFMLVNLLPLIASLFFFKVFGVSFNIATVMTFSVALGMIVDGSLHLAFDIDSKNSIEERLQQTIVPLFLGSLIPSLAFFILAFNQFLPIREFGLSLGINLLVGLFYDLAILPRLLGVAARKANV